MFEDVFGNWYDNKSKKEIVMRVLDEYFKYAKNEYQSTQGKPLQATSQQAFDVLASKRGDQVGQIATAIQMAQIPWSDIKKAMKNLAKKGRGYFPDNAGGYINAISGVATDTSFTDLVLQLDQAFKKTTDVVSGGANQSVKLFSNVNKYFPYALGVAALIAGAYFLSNSKSIRKSLK